MARSAMRWDAGYCIVMGAALAVMFRPIAETLTAPKPLIAIGGIATAGWGGLVARFSVAAPWRRVTTFVVVANLAAVGAASVVMVAADLDTPARVLLGGLSLQVLGFAAVLAHALWSPLVR